MEIKYSVNYPIDKLYQMFEIICDEGYDLNDFICPSHEYSTSDIKTNNGYLLIPFRFKKKKDITSFFL